MSKAFLSHSSQDKSKVRKIAKELGNKNCVYDEVSFEAGQKTLNEVFKGLGESDVFVFFISDAALESPWVRKEINKAKSNLDREYLQRILPIIIDSNIDYSDHRIPKWLGKFYNLKYIGNKRIILKKIQSALKEINFKNHEHNEEVEKTFVGRNELMQKFENDINNIDNWVPSFIVAYNYFQGIGRKTFLKNALKKHNLTEFIDSPTHITIDSKESVENFIYKLNTLNQKEEVSEYDFSEMNLDSKIELAEKLVYEFLVNNEIIFINDEGGIILPNGRLVDWFVQLIEKSSFHNNLTLCLVSKYKPHLPFLRTQNKSLVYRIPELTNSDTKNLFIRLLNIYDLNNIRKEDKQLFIESLKGIPAQIKYAVHFIQNNIIEAKANIQDIIEYSDRFSNTIMNLLKDTPKAYQLAIFLSTNEILSMSIIYRVFGDNEKTTKALQKLFDLSMFNFVFGGQDYIKLNPTLSDFIRRSKLKLDHSYEGKLNLITKDLLEKDLDDIVTLDYSEFMLTLRDMLKSGVNIPKKFFIPSLIIKDLIRYYDKGEYNYVIEICKKLLENKNYDRQVIWETKYRLTLALARTKNKEFFDHISYFDNDFNKLDYNFLLGFYKRNKGLKTDALHFYFKVLDINHNHSRTKREIVNIYLSQNEYQKAVELAKENFQKRPTNIYHIQSYFISLIRSEKEITNSVINELDKLKNAVDKSPNLKAEDMLNCMNGEYAYFVESDFDMAKDILLAAIKRNKNKKHPKKSLQFILKDAGYNDSLNELINLS